MSKPYLTEDEPHRVSPAATWQGSAGVDAIALSDRSWWARYMDLLSRRPPVKKPTLTSARLWGNPGRQD